MTQRTPSFRARRIVHRLRGWLGKYDLRNSMRGASITSCLCGILLYTMSAQLRQHYISSAAVEDTSGKYCRGGWVLPRINATMRSYVESVNHAWRRHQAVTLSALYDSASNMETKSGPTSEPTGWKRFDAMMPAIPEACPALARMGNGGDGGKLICGLDQITHTEKVPCVVYSIGGNNQWDFEAAIVEGSPCSVYTFDCTVDGRVPPELQGRVAFHKICLGDESPSVGATGMRFMSLTDMMDMLGHDHITLLKADIEGYEYDMFNSILGAARAGTPLPEQISFELHYLTQMEGLDWWARQKTAGEIALLARDLYDAGYRVISREDNPHCPHCSELTLVRFLCPQDRQR